MILNLTIGQQQVTANIVINPSYIPNDGGGTWGSITGTLANQTDLNTALNNKVDKVPGKGLSTEDYTTIEKNKLASLSAVPDVTVNPLPFSITVDLSEPNQLTQYQLTGATEFTPGTFAGVTGHKYEHIYILDLNSITPTFAASLKNFLADNTEAVPNLTAGYLNVLWFTKIGTKYYYAWIDSYEGTIADVIPPTLSNFTISDSYPSRVYFNSSEVITASTFTGFAISGKTISGITINAGQTTGHYFTVTSAFIQGGSHTIAYTTGSNLQDANANALEAFTATSITNNIVNPTLTSATVENATDTRLSMTFIEAVTITTAGWSVSASGGAVIINSVSGSGTSTPYFILSRSIVESETLTVSYSGGITTDLGGNPLATIINQAVTNNVTDLIVLNTPSNFVATVFSSTRIDLTWDDIANESSYQIDRSTNQIDWAQIGGTIAAGSTSYSATGLENGTLYYFRLRGIGDGITYDNSAYATDNESTAANQPPYFDSISSTAPSGTAQEGQTLTAPSVTYHDVDGDTQATTTHKWYTAPSVGGTKTVISGATETTYQCVTGDVGKYIYYGATPNAATGATPGTEVFSAATAQIEAAITAEFINFNILNANIAFTQATGDLLRSGADGWYRAASDIHLLNAPGNIKAKIPSTAAFFYSIGLKNNTNEDSGSAFGNSFCIAAKSDGSIVVYESGAQRATFAGPYNTNYYLRVRKSDVTTHAIYYEYSSNGTDWTILYTNSNVTNYNDYDYPICYLYRNGDHLTDIKIELY